MTGKPMHRQHVLFVIPCYYDFKSYAGGEITAQLPIFTIPYGVLSLAAYAKAHASTEVTFSVVDLNMHVVSIARSGLDVLAATRQFLVERVAAERPHIVAISALFNSCYDHLATITGAVRQVDEQALVVIGGGLATNLYPELLRDFADIAAACYGEGEEALCGLIEAQDKRAYLDSSPVWATRNSLAAGRTPSAMLLDDLDAIPFFDYSLIDLSSYSGRSLDKRYAALPKVEMSIHTSRGCPFDCVFCANGKVHGKKVRYMSVAKVLGEVERMVGEYAMDVLLIEDDHFLSDRKRAKTILKQLSRFGLKVEFPNGIAVYAIDEEMGELLRLAGVTTLSLAIESGSDHVLRNVIKKPLLVRMIKPAVQILRKNGIDVHAFIVTGLPGEKDADRLQTMEMLRDVGFDWVKIFIAIPIVGSRLYQICKENGYLVDDSFGACITTKCVIKSPDFDAEHFDKEVYLMNLGINFVHNYNLLAGDFDKAIVYFENILGRYPDHALAHWAIAAAYEGAGRDGKLVASHRGRFLELASRDPDWGDYAKEFGLL